MTRIRFRCASALTLALAVLSLAGCDSEGGATPPDPMRALDAGMPAAPDPDAGAPPAPAPDASTPDGCEAGAQDHDGDGVCTASCEAAGADALDCGEHGRCADGDGARACVCEAGYAGARCDACADGFADTPSGCEPALPITEGLTLRFDAASADVIVGDGDEVTRLVDAASGRVLSGAFGPPPTYLSGALGARPAIRFDAVDEVLRTVTTGDTLRSEDYTLFFVLDVEGLVSGRSIFSYGDAESSSLLLETTTGGFRFVHRSPASSAGGDAVVTGWPAHDVQIVRVVRSGSGTIRVLQINVADGTDLSGFADTAALTTDAAASDGRLFLGASASGAFHGHFAELLAYDRVLDGADSAAVVAYLRGKWGE